MTSKKKSFNSNRAFTLVETLIVVIIIGLLSGIAIVKIGNSKELAEINLKKAAIADINKAIQQINTKGRNPGIALNTYMVESVTGPLSAHNILVWVHQHGHFTEQTYEQYSRLIRSGWGDWAGPSTGEPFVGFDNVTGSISFKSTGTAFGADPRRMELVYVPGGLTEAQIMAIVYP